MPVPVTRLLRMCAVVTLVLAPPAGATLDQETTRRIDSFMNAVRSCRNFTGASHRFGLLANSPQPWKRKR